MAIKQEKQDREKRTCLYERHIAEGAFMAPFANFCMPIQYKNIQLEHLAVRHKCGLFDVSHMGQLRVTGKEALHFLQYISCNIIKSGASEGTYFHILTEQGTIIDDAIAFCLSLEEFLVVVNAACVDEDFAWFQKQASAFNVTVTNESSQWSMIALQGPTAVEIADKILPGVIDLPRFHIKEIELFGAQGYVTRTGYTGEDGVEIMLPNGQIEALWNALLKLGVKPCGLGARDVLRLEAGYLLNGADADQTKTPYEANCGWVVKLTKENFIGKSALEAKKAAGFTTKLRAFKLKNPGVPREGCKVFYQGTETGTLTSGTFSPLFKGIAVGYASSAIPVGAEVEIEIHGRKVPAEVVKTPFYKNRV